MISCLILHHSTITSLTKCKMLRVLFHEDDFEIHVIENNTVIVYLWNISKMRIWQTVMDFESTNIIVGYGFGNSKQGAYAQAEEKLTKLIGENNIKKETKNHHTF